jgi:hypothetical protein
MSKPGFVIHVDFTAYFQPNSRFMPRIASQIVAQSWVKNRTFTDWSLPLLGSGVKINGGAMRAGKIAARTAIAASDCK